MLVIPRYVAAASKFLVRLSGFPFQCDVSFAVDMIEMERYCYDDDDCSDDESDDDDYDKRDYVNYIGDLEVGTKTYSL